MRAEDLHLDPVSAALAESDRHVRGNIKVMSEWAGRPAGDLPRRLDLRFWLRPVEILGTDRVEGLRLEHTTLNDEGRVVGTGEYETLPVSLVLRSVGYQSVPLPGVPFDPRTYVVPNDGGRVLGEDGRPLPGEYVAGWIKRGPTGVIGTNKGDALETATALLADLPTLPAPAHPEPEALRAALAAYGVRPVDWTAWLRLDAEEIRRGGRRGAERVKVADIAEMLDHAHGATTP
jgi:ferredoxin--NADP+ reductase